MGLDTSHDCWHGSYSAFMVWRQKIASVAGYAVWDVKYDNGLIQKTVMIDWGHITENNLNGEWDVPQADPLIYLIAHSDCEGLIHPQQAAPLAKRLEELLSQLPDEDVAGHIGNWKSKTQKFIDGLNLAVKGVEDVIFH